MKKVWGLVFVVFALSLTVVIGQSFALPIDGGMGATNMLVKENKIYGVQGNINWSGSSAPSASYHSIGIRTSDAISALNYRYVQWGWYQNPGLGLYVDGIVRSRSTNYTESFIIPKLYQNNQGGENDHYAIIFNPVTNQFTAYLNGTGVKQFTVFGFTNADIAFAGVGYMMGGTSTNRQFSSLSWVRKTPAGVLMGKSWPTNVPDIRKGRNCTYQTKNSFTCN